LRRGKRSKNHVPSIEKRGFFGGRDTFTDSESCRHFLFDCELYEFRLSKIERLLRSKCCEANVAKQMLQSKCCEANVAKQMLRSKRAWGFPNWNRRQIARLSGIRYPRVCWLDCPTRGPETTQLSANPFHPVYSETSSSPDRYFRIHKNIPRIDRLCFCNARSCNTGSQAVSLKHQS